jgi:LCP family protein required for cell wall assembly
MMLMHVSADRARVTVVSIPRDSWVNIPGHGMSKINAAYGFGGPKLMVQTVEQATGLTINDYVEVDFLGFVKVIDALGGVNICLPQPVDDSYSGLRLSAGMHHVDGITALAYARDRHSFATSDLARIQDQQRLLSSALTEAIGSGLLANPIRLSRFLRAAAETGSCAGNPRRLRAAGWLPFRRIGQLSVHREPWTGQLAYGHRIRRREFSRAGRLPVTGRMAGGPSAREPCPAHAAWAAPAGHAMAEIITCCHVFSLLRHAAPGATTLSRCD